MNLLIAIGAVFALLTVFFLARSVRCTRRGRLLRAGGAGITGIGTAIVAPAAVRRARTYLSSERRTAEQRVSPVTFRQTAAEEFPARRTLEGHADRPF